MYNKTVWKTGDIIPADKMNNIENGIGANDIAITDIKKELVKTVKTSEKGTANGIATLDETGKIPQDQLPELDFIPNSEKGQPDGVAPLNKDGVLDIIYGGTKAKTAQEALYNLGCGVRQNLIKNGYFIGGRTNNALPINQKGSRTYSTGQSIDCWKLSGVGSQNIRLDSDGIAIYSNAENGAYLTQILDEDIIQQIKGQTVTLSALFAYNNARLAMYLDINDEIIGGTGWETNTGFISAKINIPQEIESAKIFFGAEIKGEAKVKLCKMEIGDTQTLCWQNTSKQWIPFEKPDYSTELLKCQRYYQIYSSAENRPNSYIDCRPVMRKPDDGEITQGTIQINDVTYYYNSAEL